MGLIMPTEHEFQAREQGSDLRNSLIPYYLSDLGFTYDEEELVAAIWIFAWLPVNEEGLYDIILSYFNKKRISQNVTEEEKDSYAEKMYMSGLLKRGGAPDAFVQLHWPKIQRNWRYYADMVDRLMLLTAEEEWLTEEVYVPEDRQTDETGRSADKVPGVKMERLARLVSPNEAELTARQLYRHARNIWQQYEPKTVGTGAAFWTMQDRQTRLAREIFDDNPYDQSSTFQDPR
ncbi:uncharacterized protein KY384_003888 [Bacidia gigantensis]|uniref:uncharacterized protein n=1 Tax=Bacidia gigantensis TaxID=2732470 RepID=UPI001D03A205|nr:uncharacterized protein KY384_003888 [Bacidia gigantensis]KAG8532247.1 hypothetical protein KY384_003888 [Bacidia gigantensis]